ncbi:hypothetical protein ACP70R_028456 [Stipagrostis hirtigluma subsp. patula]
MPDLSRADCRSCMGDIIEMMQQCSGRLSGTIQGLSCSFSYAVAAFYSGSPTLRLPPPVPAPAACTVISSDEATRRSHPMRIEKMQGYRTLQSSGCGANV